LELSQDTVFDALPKVAVESHASTGTSTMLDLEAFKNTIFSVDGILNGRLIDEVRCTSMAGGKLATGALVDLDVVVKTCGTGAQDG
jgi:hypothetical protein